LPIALPTPVPPEILKRIVLLFGYKELGATEYNWILSRDGEDEPLVLPRLGRVVSVIVMDKVFEHTGMTLGTYMAIKGIVENGSDLPIN